MPKRVITEKQKKRAWLLLRTLPAKEVAEMLGLKYSTLRTMAQRAGFKRQNRYWRPADITYLRKHYNADKTIVEIAEHLGKTKWAVINKMRELRQK